MASSVVSAEQLHALFRPRRIAIVGASDKSYFSQAAVDNLLHAGYGDRLHLVNRRSPTAHGIATVASVADIGEPVDLAFTMVPQAATLDALAEAAAAGVRSAVVMSSGYAETGAAGRGAQDELVRHATELGIAVLGPNNLGFANFVDRIPVTPIPNLPQTAGGVALLSQSGASSSAMMEFAATADVGLSHLVTLGNEAMVTAGHVLDHLVDDARTQVIAIFLESVREPEVFRRAARRALAAGKPVVVLKAGRSELAARTAAAHTGALVGDDASATAVFRELGIIQVRTIEDMLVTAGAAARLGRLARPGVGVVSISGGACDILADIAEDTGLPLPALAPQTTETLRAVMPGFGTVQNPLDVTGAAVLDPTLFTSAITAMAHDPHLGAVLVVTKIPWEPDQLPFRGQAFIDAIGKGVAAAPVPVVFVNQVVQPITATTRAVMAHGGIPYAICGIASAVTALGHLGWWSRRTVEPVASPPVLTLPGPDERRGAWSEEQARALLAAAGIPVVPSVLARSADEAAAAAGSFGSAVAVKLVSPQILHKSDIGGVRLGVTGAQDVRAAFDAVTAAGGAVPGASVEGALVSPMRTGGVEVLAGVVHDAHWGPMLAVALGGVLVEVLADAALASLPISTARARELVLSLRGAGVLAGVRGRPAADLDALAQVISGIGDLALALGDDLESLEVNPLHVDGATIEALDAVVTWRTPAATGKQEN